MKGCCKGLIPPCSSLLCQAGLTAQVTSCGVSPTPDLPFLLSSPPGPPLGQESACASPTPVRGSCRQEQVDLATRQGGTAEPNFLQVLLDYTHYLLTIFREEGAG